MFLALYALYSLWCKWLLSWGGADKIEGWLAALLIGGRAWGWDAEQIRLYALCSWVAYTVFCLLLIVVSCYA